MRPSLLLAVLVLLATVAGMGGYPTCECLCITIGKLPPM